MSVLLWGLLACGSPPAEPSPPSPPDILLVVLDTVRPDALSAYGNPRPSSPQFDAIAAAGVLFEDASSSSSWTWPAHGTLFTGLPPEEHGAMLTAGEAASSAGGGPKLPVTQLRDEVQTIAQRLQRQGYRSASFSGNPMLRPELGMVRGFDEAEALDSDAEVLRSAMIWLEQQPEEQPVFLFINLIGAHAPYEVQAAQWLSAHREALTPGSAGWLEPFLLGGGEAISLYRPVSEQGTSGVHAFVRGEMEIPEEGLELLRAVYEGEVLGVDRHLNALLKGWQARRSGVVAVTSDHGELLGERDLLMHGHALYPELVQVPMALVAPDLQPGRRVKEPVTLAQLHDTLLDYAGLEGAQSMRSWLREGRPGPSQEIRARVGMDPSWAAGIGAPFDQGYRLLRVGPEVLLAGDQRGERYFRLDEDPSWEHDRAAEFPERVQQLRRRLSSSPSAESAGAMLPSEADEALRALGYIE